MFLNLSTQMMVTITHRSRRHPTQPSVSHLRAEVSTITTKQILEKPCTASGLEQNITRISLNCGFQAPLGPLLGHNPSWWGQRDRPTFYSKLATPIAISTDVTPQKGPRETGVCPKVHLGSPGCLQGALKCSASVAAQISLGTGSLWGLMPQPPGHHVTSHTSQFHPHPPELLKFSLLLEG